MNDENFLRHAEEMDKVIRESFGLLAKVLAESNEFEKADDYRAAFVYRHGRNIYQLGQDVVFLLESVRLESCQALVRVMLESLFKLITAVKQQDAAVQILVSEVEADAERMKLLDPVECAPGIKHCVEFAAKLRRKYNIISKKQWNTFECAVAAGLINEYRSDYFVFSGRTHASTGGIIMQEKQIGAGHALHILLYIVIRASGGCALAIQTKTPQQHIDDTAQLIDRLVELIKNGIFKELDGDLSES